MLQIHPSIKMTDEQNVRSVQLRLETLPYWIKCLSNVRKHEFLARSSCTNEDNIKKFQD